MNYTKKIMQKGWNRRTYKEVRRELKRMWEEELQEDKNFDNMNGRSSVEGSK